MRAYTEVPPAENAVLDYLKRVLKLILLSNRTHFNLIIIQMNRPFGAVDVSSNLKGAVPKTATQKILLALAEKGDVTQKLYGEPISGLNRIYAAYVVSPGKTTFFVANQGNIDTLPAEKLAKLDEENKSIEEENKCLAAEVKAAASGTSLVHSRAPFLIRR